jgi:hypothetical protein
MLCEPRYTARRLAFTLSILPVFPFNFSQLMIQTTKVADTKAQIPKSQ